MSAQVSPFLALLSTAAALLRLGPISRGLPEGVGKKHSSLARAESKRLPPNRPYFPLISVCVCFRTS
jgi:hypothetical protein